jgi:hypothetical protein
MHHVPVVPTIYRCTYSLPLYLQFAVVPIVYRCVTFFVGSWNTHTRQMRANLEDRQKWMEDAAAKEVDSVLLIILW